MTMNISLVKQQRGPYVKLKFNVGVQLYASTKTPVKTTEEICIDDLVKLKFKFETFFPPNPPLHVRTSVSMMTPVSRDYSVTLKIVGKNFGHQWECPRMFTSWIEINTAKYEEKNEFDILVNKTEAITFAKLYNDIEITDFKLRAGEESVAVHRAILAAHSDFFKTMFRGNWTETENNSAELTGVTAKTLNDLKDYLYLGTLPDSGLKELLLVAQCFLIESLKKGAITKLVEEVTAETLNDLVEFACEHNVQELVIMLLNAKQEVIYGE